MKKTNLGAFALIVLLFCGVSAWGQATVGQIVGKVVDTSGALITGAKVVATNTDTGVVSTATATGAGEYEIVNLLSGPYTITASAPGFGTSTTKGFIVDANKTSTADFKLLAASSSSVEVTTDAAVALDTTTSQLQQTFTAKELSDVPIAATSVLNLSFLAPGVGGTGGLGEGSGPSIAGQRARNNSFTVDGTDNNDKNVTGQDVNVQNEAVAEFTLLQNVFNAEYGHSNGGQFNVAIKSGTNKYHGAVYEYFQNRNLNAFDNAEKLEGLTSQPRFDNNRYGGQFSGPIKKDKLFFFGDFEQQPSGSSGGSGAFCAPTAAGYALLTKYRAGTNLTVLQQYLSASTAGDPNGNCNTYSYKDSSGTTHSYADSITLTQSGVAGDVGPNGDQVLIPIGSVSSAAPSYTNGRYIAASADYVISNKDNIRFRYAYGRLDGIDTAANLPVFFTSQPNRNTIGSLTYVHDFTANLINEAHIGFNRHYATSTAPGVFPGLSVFPNIQLDDLTLNLGPDGNAPQGGTQNLFQFTDNVTYIKGHHTMKFGFDGRKYISWTDFVQRSRGDYEYSNTSDLYLEDLSPDVLGQRNASGAVSTRYYGDQTEFYGFAQDDWRVTPQLSLNLGLRYEFSSIPAGIKNQALNAAASLPGLIVFAKPEPAKKDFGPHFGLAYAPNATTSIRAGFALGYDVLYDNIGTTEAPPQQQVTENVNLAVQTPNFLKGGGLAAQAAPSYATVAAQRAATSTYLPDQFKMPYTESWSFGVQHVFHSDYTAEIRYVGNHSVHLDTQQQINKQPIVTSTFNLPTVIGSPSAAQTASTLTLANFQTLSAANAAFIPAYLAAGFTSAITSYQYSGQSNYNGLQTQLQRRLKNGLLFNTAYTWSKAMDNSTDDFNSTALNPRRAQDQLNYLKEYSLSALSHKHRFTAEILYDIPFFKNSNFLLRNVLGNWEIAPIYTYESGQFVTPQSGIDSNLNGDSAGDRAIVNPGGNKSKGSAVTAFYNPALAGLCPVVSGLPTNCTKNLVGYTANDPTAYYIATGSGAYATASRSMLPTPAINDLDMSVLKRISYRERYAFEFTATATNVVNHPQYITGTVNFVGSTATTGAALQAYTIPGKTSFLNPKAVFGSDARSMILTGRIKF
jgi:hypothetical protein